MWARDAPRVLIGGGGKGITLWICSYNGYTSQNGQDTNIIACNDAMLQVHNSDIAWDIFE